MAGPLGLHAATQPRRPSASPPAGPVQRGWGCPPGPRRARAPGSFPRCRRASYCLTPSLLITTRPAGPSSRRATSMCAPSTLWSRSSRCARRALRGARRGVVLRVGLRAVSAAAALRAAVCFEGWAAAGSGLRGAAAAPAARFCTAFTGHRAFHLPRPCLTSLPPRSKPPVPPELELVETEDQITHEVTLEDKLEPQVGAGRQC